MLIAGDDATRTIATSTASSPTGNSRDHRTRADRAGPGRDGTGEVFPVLSDRPRGYRERRAGLSGAENPRTSATPERVPRCARPEARSAQLGAGRPCRLGSGSTGQFGPEASARPPRSAARVRLLRRHRCCAGAAGSPPEPPPPHCDRESASPAQVCGAATPPPSYRLSGAARPARRRECALIADLRKGPSALVRRHMSGARRLMGAGSGCSACGGARCYGDRRDGLCIKNYVYLCGGLDLSGAGPS